eukprot:TRINITY_DN1987_c0_g1_i1.p1 TRINITY_DN1987_c0_g1~~TRINITY_DN1987_c0_g1_i1.p1  ORF type:complete len:214 (+),score=57.74 TRINITY_DN1987_c0_g1_i1:72-713(+)
MSAQPSQPLTPAASVIQPGQGIPPPVVQTQGSDVPFQMPTGPQFRVLKRTTAGIKKKEEAFEKAVSLLPGMKERMDELSDKIYAAEKEKQDHMGKIEKEIANHELEVITKALLKQNKMPKDMMELAQLRQAERQNEMEKNQKRQKLDQEVNEKVAQESRFKEIEFQQKFSEYTAREQAFLNEKRTLLETISSLRAEISSQKKLSSDIAKSANK